MTSSPVGSLRSSSKLHDLYARLRGDLIYALLLLVCAGLSLARRRLKLHSPDLIPLLRNTDGLIGVVLTLTVVDHPLMLLCSLSVVVAHLVMYRVVRDAGLITTLSFYGTFAHLGALRCQHLVFGWPRLAFVTNAIQLIMTLRVIGLSYEIADARLAKKEDDAAAGKVKIHRVIDEPSTLDAFNYLYSFTGLFTGPYYTYQTYTDSWNYHNGRFPEPPITPLIAAKARTLAWSLPLLVVLSVIDPVKVLRGEKIDAYSLPVLFVWCGVAFVYLRMRIYSAWMVAESICICSGIGLYPVVSQPEPGRGPRNLDASKAARNDPSTEYNAETIANLDIPAVEYSDGFRTGMRAWNRTVQYWLANYVYRRTHRSIRMLYTMLVSAFWHGIHPGYFLSFLTIPLCTAAEDALFSAVPVDAKTGQRPFPYSIAWSFVRTRGFELMACGFLLLTWEDTVRLWANMYFWLHAMMILVLVTAKVYLVFTKFSMKQTNTHVDSLKKE